MAELTDDEKNNWDRRRRNIRILLAAEGLDATNLARDIGLSPNTITKFLSGKTPTLSPRSMDRVLPGLGLRSVDQLDTDNPLSDPKIRVQKVIDRLDGPVVDQLAAELEARFPGSK